MDLSGIEFFIAALTAFYLGHSCTMLALSFRGTTGCRGQNHPRLCLKTIWTFIICPQQCLSSARALGSNVKWARVTNSLAPQQPLKILLPDLLVGEEGFGDVGPISWLTQLCPSLMSVSLHFPGRCRVMRHSFRFTYVALLPFHCMRRVFNKFSLRGHSNPTVVNGDRSWVEIISLVTLLGNLCRLNATKLAFHIRSKVGGHFLYVQTLQSLQSPKPPAMLKVFVTSAIKPQSVICLRQR